MNLGKYSIDIKAQAVYLTQDPANKEERYDFKEELTQKRDFRNDPSRFQSNITGESLERNEADFNFLGECWFLNVNRYKN